jgi:flagellar basal-body rod protein FlgC
MDHQHIFAISAAGMDVERLRVEVAASNLANANTSARADGTGYMPMRVVAQPGIGSASIGSASGFGSAGFASRVAQGMTAPIAVIEPTGTPARRVNDPGHPMADASGFVSYPGVDTTTEMLTIMTALRAYEANVAALNAGRTMVLKALEIGGPQ